MHKLGTCNEHILEQVATMMVFVLGENISFDVELYSISPIYLSVIFSNSLALRSHIPLHNGFIVVKQYKLCQGWAKIGSLPLLLDK
jgi:hypothetical protein